MKVLQHHIYEYKKGLRNLVLHTMKTVELAKAEQVLQHNQIDYLVREVSATKVNIFFGNSSCVNVIRQFGQKALNEFTAEEDFILGIMLGYDRLKQCDRFIERTAKVNPNLQQMLLLAYEN